VTLPINKQASHKLVITALDIVIDLGASHAVTGFQCLRRMESEVPGGIKDFKIYVKGENFKY